MRNGLLVRYQIGVDDRQFLRSMIPHRAGAILMCENANLSGKEIAEMQSLLEVKSP